MDEGGSDALLGIFAAVAPAASAALQSLDGGDAAGFRAALDPTVALARHLFGAPTYYYKTGIAFLARLSGHQPGLGMVRGLQSGRSVVHLAEATGSPTISGCSPTRRSLRRACRRSSM